MSCWKADVGVGGSTVAGAGAGAGAGPHGRTPPDVDGARLMEGVGVGVYVTPVVVYGRCPGRRGRFLAGTGAPRKDVNPAEEEEGCENVVTVTDAAGGAMGLDLARSRAAVGVNVAAGAAVLRVARRGTADDTAVVETAANGWGMHSWGLARGVSLPLSAAAPRPRPCLSHSRRWSLRNFSSSVFCFCSCFTSYSSSDFSMLICWYSCKYRTTTGMSS